MFRAVLTDFKTMTSDGRTDLGTLSFQQFKPAKLKVDQWLSDYAQLLRLPHAGHRHISRPANSAVGHAFYTFGVCLCCTGQAFVCTDNPAKLKQSIACLARCVIVPMLYNM